MDNDVCSIYESNGAYYLDCFGTGTAQIRASQPGNKNYHAATRVANKVVVSEVDAIYGSPASNIKITTGMNQITIHNKPKTANVSVYSLSGSQLYQGRDNVIRLPAGYYIVNIETARTKVVVR